MYYICDFFKYSTVKLKMETKYYSTLFPILCLEKKRSLTRPVPEALCTEAENVKV